MAGCRALELELVKQESLLAFAHAQQGRGAAHAGAGAEALWDVQRLVTQLKREVCSLLLKPCYRNSTFAPLQLKKLRKQQRDAPLALAGRPQQREALDELGCRAARRALAQPRAWRRSRRSSCWR